MLVTFVDGVVASTEVSSGMDKIYVEVGVVILLEVDGEDLFGVYVEILDLELGEEGCKDLLIFGSSFFFWLLSSILTQFHLNLFRYEWINMYLSSHSSNKFSITYLWNTQVKGYQIGTCSHKMYMKGVFWVKGDWSRSTFGT